MPHLRPRVLPSSLLQRNFSCFSQTQNSHLIAHSRSSPISPSAAGASLTFPKCCSQTFPPSSRPFTRTAIKLYRPVEEIKSRKYSGVSASFFRLPFLPPPAPHSFFFPQFSFSKAEPPPTVYFLHANNSARNFCFSAYSPSPSGLRSSFLARARPC